MDATYRLSDQTEREVQELLHAGQFESAEDVLQEGVRLVRRQAQRRAALLALVEPALASLEQGRTIPAEDVFDRLIARYEADAQVRR